MSSAATTVALRWVLAIRPCSPNVSPGPSERELFAFALDARGALVDDRQVLREVALAHDHAAGFDALLGDRAADRLQRVLIQSFEERELRETSHIHVT